MTNPFRSPQCLPKRKVKRTVTGEMIPTPERYPNATPWRDEDVELGNDTCERLIEIRDELLELTAPCSAADTWESTSIKFYYAPNYEHWITARCKAEAYQFYNTKWHYFFDICNGGLKPEPEPETDFSLDNLPKRFEEWAVPPPPGRYVRCIPEGGVTLAIDGTRQRLIELYKEQIALAAAYVPKKDWEKSNITIDYSFKLKYCDRQWKHPEVSCKVQRDFRDEGERVQYLFSIKPVFM